RADKRMHRRQLANVGLSLRKAFNPDSGRRLRPQLQPLRPESALQGAHGKLRVAARRDHRATELKCSHRAVAALTIGLGQILQRVLGQALAQEKSAYIERRVDEG